MADTEAPLISIDIFHQISYFAEQSVDVFIFVDADFLRHPPKIIKTFVCIQKMKWLIIIDCFSTEEWRQ